jgi:tryptophanyl-tRNA synthetase
MWILSTVASMGYLSRMTQWKVGGIYTTLYTRRHSIDTLQSKLQLPEDTSLDDSTARAQLRLGLFSYPVLQAADILVHRYMSLVYIGSFITNDPQELRMSRLEKTKDSTWSFPDIPRTASTTSTGPSSPSRRP